MLTGTSPGVLVGGWFVVMCPKKTVPRRARVKERRVGLKNWEKLVGI
jgi:hypothetical protein